MAAGDSPALVQGFYKLPSAGRLDSPFDFAQGRLERLSPRVCPYSIVDPSRLVPILLPIPKHGGDGAFPLVRFRRKDRRNGLFVERQLFHHHFLERQIDDDELGFRRLRPPGLRSRPMDHQQHQSPRRRIFRSKLGGNLGISIAEVSVVGVDHLVIIFRLIQQWIGATAGNYHILDAIAIQIGRERGRPRHKLAGRPKLLLDEAVVHSRFVLGGSLGRRLNYRLTRLLGLSIQKKRDSYCSKKTDTSWGWHSTTLIPCDARH